ncbi:MAG: hypothetical protein JXM70_12315 [Pirellulales bacterium]|nr:hypothetical protein [Pirellulales bacterium]
MRPLLLLTVTVSLILSTPVGESIADELFIGSATADITPTGPVALCGQFRLRISKKNETPLEACVVVLETRRDGKTIDTAIMITCDLVWGSDAVFEVVRQAVKKRLPDLDTGKIFISGTHTHTAPVLLGGKDCLYQIPKQGVVQVEEYLKFLGERIAEAVEKAWKTRSPGSFTWGLSHAVVAYNRRVVYDNGSAKMYGVTHTPNFSHIEGYEDHDIGTLFFWNKTGELIAIAVNVSCPAQEVEHRNEVNADYWHPTRQLLRKRFGKNVNILTWIGAAGDQSPHIRFRKAADDRMRRLRNLDTLGEIARRIDRAVDEAFEVVKNDRHSDVTMIHDVQKIRLPVWPISYEEYAESKADMQKSKDKIAKDPKEADKGAYLAMRWHGEVVRRYEREKADPKAAFETEIHVLRLGDVAICTNPFELFTDFGIRMKARSKANQTFVVQLTGGPGGGSPYLPPERSKKKGGYSAIAPSCNVGPEGGKVLVDHTVNTINELMKK